MSSVSSSEGDLAALEEHIPTSILATCHEGNMREETQDSVIASVTCTPGIQQGNDLQYMKAHDTLAVRTLFRTRAEQYVGSELASGEDAVSTCATRTPGQFRWYALRMPNDSSGVVERVFHRTEDTTSGLAMCYSEDGMAWLEWVDLDTQIYAFASTPVEFYPLLYDWWLQEAGPNHPMGNMAPTDTNSTGPSGPADPEM